MYDTGLSRTPAPDTVVGQVYLAIRTMILESELAPGSPLSESDLSRRLGASRTPVREALGRLAWEGLVRQYPGRGAFVSELSVPEVVKLFQIREALETHAARLAAEAPNRGEIVKLRARLEEERSRLDEGEIDSYYELMSNMDQVIIGLAQNDRLASMLNEVWIQISRARRMASRNQVRLAETVNEHAAILDAISAGDATAAAEATRVHVRHSLANITSVL